jgi:AraC-like DNA-binding protein
MHHPAAVGGQGRFEPAVAAADDGDRTARGGQGRPDRRRRWQIGIGGGHADPRQEQEGRSTVEWCGTVWHGHGGYRGMMGRGTPDVREEWNGSCHPCGDLCHHPTMPSLRMPPRLLHAWHVHHAPRPDQSHVHPWHELVLVVGGLYIASSPGGSVRAGPGAVVHWPAGMAHRISGEQAVSALVLQYREAGPRPARRPRLISQPPPRLHADARRIISLADAPEPRLRRVANALLDLVLWQIEAGEAGEPPLLHRIRVLVAARMHERWPVARIADELGMSVRHLHRRLRTECGLSPRAAVAGLRVEKALPLLTEDAITVDAVAHRVGAGSRGQLTRLMRAHTGSTPAALRRGGGGAEARRVASGPGRRAQRNPGTPEKPEPGPTPAPAPRGRRGRSRASRSGRSHRGR